MCATSSTSWTTCTSTFASPSRRCSRRASAWRRSARRASRCTIAAPAKASLSSSKVTRRTAGEAFGVAVYHSDRKLGLIPDPRPPCGAEFTSSPSVSVGFCPMHAGTGSSLMHMNVNNDSERCSFRSGYQHRPLTSEHTEQAQRLEVIQNYFCYFQHRTQTQHTLLKGHISIFACLTSFTTNYTCTLLWTTFRNMLQRCRWLNKFSREPQVDIYVRAKVKMCRGNCLRQTMNSQHSFNSLQLRHTKHSRTIGFKQLIIYGSNCFN